MSDKNTEINEDNAARFNQGKIEYHLLPREALDALARVLNRGAKKYAERNWEKGGPLKVPYNSMIRHILSWVSGEDIDPESGESHMAHVLANATFIITYMERGIGKDFRPGKTDDRTVATYDITPHLPILNRERF